MFAPFREGAECSDRELRSRPHQRESERNRTLAVDGTACDLRKLFSLPVDGQIYAQPLYQQSIPIPERAFTTWSSSKRSTTVYTPLTPTRRRVPLVDRQSRTLGPASALQLGIERHLQDITPEIGILGTPVIDPSTGTFMWSRRRRERRLSIIGCTRSNIERAPSVRRSAR